MSENAEVSLKEQASDEAGMAEKLVNAGKIAETQRTQRRERQVKGSHLLGQLTSAAEAAGLKIDDKTGFHKISGPVKGRSIYVAKKGGRVDISGFELSDPAVIQLTEAQAREKHLGKVRGQLDFSQPDEAVLTAYSAALAKLQAE